LLPSVSILIPFIYNVCRDFRDAVMEAICILNHPKYAAMSIEEHQAALTEDQWTILMAWMAGKIGNAAVR
jgi:hypothetical protein